MCTVTYIARPQGGFVLSSNRDETPARAVRSLVQKKVGGKIIVFPQDPGAGGTWIAAHEAGYAICLLNGAFERHDRTPPYRMSRGILVLELLESGSVPSSFHSYPLQGIEPFTLVYASPHMLGEFRWDGRQRYARTLDPSAPHIWSSATLYDPAVRARREGWFQQWQRAHPQADWEQILHFHRYAGEGDPWNDVIMDRQGIVQTISITQVIQEGNGLKMQYYDLLSSENDSIQIDVPGEVVEPDSSAPALLD